MDRKITACVDARIGTVLEEKRDDFAVPVITCSPERGGSVFTPGVQPFHFELGQEVADDGEPAFPGGC